MRFTLIQSVLAVALLSLGVAIGTTLFVNAKQRQRVEICGNNLGTLWKAAQCRRLLRFGGTQPGYQYGYGAAFWRALRSQEANPSPMDAATTLRNASVLQCPLAATDYRGPSGDANQYGDNDPLGADAIDAHGSQSPTNVLLKSGTVMLVQRPHPIWVAAYQMTCP